MSSPMIMNDFSINPFLASPLGEAVDFPSTQSPEEFASLFLYPEADDASPPLFPLPPTPQLGAQSYSSAFSTVSSSPLSLSGDTSPFDGFGFDMSFSSTTTLGLQTPDEDAKPSSYTNEDFSSLFTSTAAALPASSTWSPIDVPLPLSSISPSLTRLPSPTPAQSAPLPPVASTEPPKKDKHTGTRNTKIPAIPLDAPTMSRTYLIPATTSRKRAPAAITSKLSLSSSSSKRSRKSSKSSSPPLEREEGERESQMTTMDVGEEGLDPSLLPEELLSAIEEKRRSNTLAARKSRMRKAGYLKDLEGRLETKEGECEALKKRCQELEELVRTLRGC